MSPAKLLKVFLTVSFLSVCLTLGLFYIGMKQSLQDYNIESAKRDSINIAYTLFNKEHQTLINPETQKLHFLIPAESFKGFDVRMRQLLQPLNIVKIKIFSKDEYIVYSTDQGITGQHDTNNPRLKRALNGEIDSSFGRKEIVADLMNESRFDVDVVETYLPMIDLNGQIQGAYEVYVDITPYRELINNTIRTQAIMIASLLLLTFTILALIMRKGTQNLTSVQNDLHHQATYDDLTELYNRSYLNTRLNEELEKVRRTSLMTHQYKSGVVILDIDFFKKINDNFGHLVGDKVLIEIGQCFHSVLREGDIVGRFGGEEFLAILPNSNTDNTLLFAKRLHQVIKSNIFLKNDQSLKITVSLGVSSILDTDSSIDDVLLRSDTALYQVKESGRDGISEFRQS